MAKTLQTRFIEGLLGRGYVELTATRYVGAKAFKHPSNPSTLIFVGKGGSLRSGQNRTSSMNCSNKFRELLLTPLDASDLI